MLYSAVQQLKQSKFNNSNQYATTSFVQDALGNISNATTITAASTTLTVAQAGQAFLFSTASASVILPAASGIPAGGTYKLHTSSGFTLTVNGGGAMQAGNASVTSLTVPSGTKVLAISTGTAWWVFGTGTIANSAGFAASKAASGWYYLPSGMIVQWGTQATSSGSGTISFPIPFPNAVTSLTLTDQAGSVATCDVWGAGAITTSTAVVYSATNAGGSASTSCYWRAEGY